MASTAGFGIDSTMSRRGYQSVSLKDSSYNDEEARLSPFKQNSLNAASTSSQPVIYAAEDDGGPSRKGLQQELPIERNRADIITALVLLACAAALRFIHIGHPSGVAFDEVHFGRL